MLEDGDGGWRPEEGRAELQVSLKKKKGHFRSDLKDKNRLNQSLEDVEGEFFKQCKDSSAKALEVRLSVQELKKVDCRSSEQNRTYLRNTKPECAIL